MRYRRRSGFKKKFVSSRRAKLGKRYSKKLFSKTARRTHRRNGGTSTAMRGGIRL